MGSMVHSDGRLYLLMKNGDTLILAAKPKFELLATNSLGRGEQTNSSIAVSDGELYIHLQNLYCIRERSNDVRAAGFIGRLQVRPG